MRSDFGVNRDKAIMFIALALFCIVTVTLMLHHEAWGDEARPWLLARNSPSIFNLLSIVGYEGTPGLWYLLTFVLVNLGLGYTALFILHSLIALAAVSIFLFCAPFSLTKRILFIFSYLFVYEYNIIARNYAISALLLFIIASIWKRRFEKPILFSSLILLLVNSNVHSIPIGASILFVSAIEFYYSNKMFNKKILLSLLVVVFGFALSLYQIYPPPDLIPELARWRTDISMQHLGVLPHVFTSAFLPIPNPGPHSWNTYLLYDLFGKESAMLGIILFLITVLFFVQKPAPLMVYLISVVGLEAIFFFKLTGGIRHHGLIFLTFFFSLWLSSFYQAEWTFLKKIAKKPLVNQLASFFIFFILITQLTSGAIIAYQELKYEFSTSKAAAAILRGFGSKENVLIATFPKTLGEHVLPYMKKGTHFFRVEYNNYTDIIPYGKSSLHENNSNITDEEIIKRISNEKDGYKRVLLVIDREFDNGPVWNSTLVAYLNESVNEDYLYIYEINFNNSTKIS